MNLDVGGRQRRRALLAGVVVAALVALAAILVLPSDDTVAADDGVGAPAGPFTTGKPPRRLEVPSIGLDAPLKPIEVDTAGVLTPPADASTVGWWQRSAHPGAPVGQTVLTGHTLHAGGGVMNRLGKVERGAVVKVYDDGQAVDYRVTRVAEYSKAEVTEHAYDLFGQKRRGGRLVLVTCTDWVDGDYLSNIVVFAKPVPAESA